ncbi:hypothetical protein ACRAWG_02905 [Methylobacterium sp. P31]
MSLDRQIVRLMAAMILAIIAYVAPSAVQAHEGHAHHGHHAAATQSKVAPPVTQDVASAVTAAHWLVTQAAMPTSSKVALAMNEGAGIEPSEDDCCPVGCKTLCCGTMVCCATGILSDPAALSPSLFRTVTLIPRDVAGRAGTGPEALPKPPRTLA